MVKEINKDQNPKQVIITYEMINMHSAKRTYTGDRIVQS